jgi:PAT family beta-lactamase induction signal transducer AmpG
MDRFTPPFLGRRRGWMLITQVLLVICMAVIGQFSTHDSILLIAALALLIAFLSASQDIVLDAYRRELLPDRELGLGTALYVNGYRAAVLIPGGLGVFLGGILPWNTVFIIVAALMGLSVIKTLTISETAATVIPPKTLREAVIEPFRDFFKRDGVGQALIIMLFLFCYKLGDNMATALATPFFIDLGFSLEVIGSVVKITNLSALLIGSVIGGVLIFKIGINRGLWLCGVAQLLTILGFAVLSEIGPDVRALVIVLAGEYLGVGLGTAALTAYMARITNINFTATQFALLSSLIALPRTFANATTGFLIAGVTPEDGIYYRILGELPGMGYTMFFVFCAVCGLPGMFLLLKIAPWGKGS